MKLAVLLDGRGGLEAESVQDSLERVRVRDRRLVLLAGLRRRLQQRPLVRELRHGVARGRLAAVRFCRFSAHPERLVGLGEIAVRRVVVDVRLRDRPDELRPEFVQPRPDRVVVGAHLHLHFVHGPAVGRHAQKPTGSGVVDPRQADSGRLHPRRR